MCICGLTLTVQVSMLITQEFIQRENEYQLVIIY